MRTFLLLVGWLLLALPTSATIRLHTLFTDHMVLQQQHRVPFAGTASPNEQITVRCSWLNEAMTTKADAEGHWQVNFTTPQATFTPQTIEIQGADENLTLGDILIGEVWLCAGQSNMQMTLRGFPSQPVEGGLEEIAQAATYKKLRLFHVPAKYAETRQDHCKGEWTRSTPATASTFTAVGFVFGSRLSEAMDVPVGIISSAYGGSRIESWMDEATLAQFDKKDYIPKADKPYRDPVKIYNAMIAPIEGFPLAGVVWLQGESNRRNAYVYADMLRAMIGLWRTQWQQPSLPFIICHIAPLPYNSIGELGGARVQEAQWQVTRTDKAAYLVGTSDIGDEKMVHYPKKRVVGERVLYSAMANVYKVEGIPTSGPTLDKVTFEKGKAIVRFAHAERGLTPINQPIHCFELAGEDLKFYPAEAKIGKDRATVEVKAKEVTEPRYVRYAFTNWHQTNLADVYGLPAIPFRTDSIRYARPKLY